MPNWTEHDLQNQFHRADNNGWIPFFEAAGAAHGFAAEFLMAIASRETNMQNIKGDLRGGICHGYGIMQVDIGTDPAFCQSWTSAAVQPSINRGTEILAGKRDFLAHHNITDPKAIAAAYNTGEGNVSNSVAHGRDADSTTTGGDYGKDVLDRMSIFVRLRAPAPAVTA
jgi:hypothetical protein